MVKERIQNGVSKITTMVGDITFIRNYLMEWEPDYATQSSTQSKAQGTAKDKAESPS